MDKETLSALYDQVCGMTEDDRRDLDPVARALGDYLQKHHPAHLGYNVPNRIAALAAVKAMQAWESAIWEAE